MNKQEIEKALEWINYLIDNFGTEPRKILKDEVYVIKSALEAQKAYRWIPASEGLPEEHRCSDEDDCYRMSDNVLCSAYNEDINEYETWIDYTIDGEWQTHEYYEGEKLAWQPLPEPYKGE